MPAVGQELTEAWRVGGFATPESVSYDPASQTLFVSNINSPDMGANGEGYISQMSLEGDVISERFVEGLSAPKGTVIVDGTLYVAGVEELVAIFGSARSSGSQSRSRPGTLLCGPRKACPRLTRSVQDGSRSAPVVARPRTLGARRRVPLQVVVLVAGRTAGVASRRVKVAAGQGMLDN